MVNLKEMQRKFDELFADVNAGDDFKIFVQNKIKQESTPTPERTAEEILLSYLPNSGNYNFKHSHPHWWKKTLVAMEEYRLQGKSCGDAAQFGEWLRTFEPLTKENNQWVLDCQISTDELYKAFLKDTQGK